MPEYATVEVNKLNDRAANQHLRAPVVVRGNRIRSVTLTIPLLESDKRGRGTYLIVKLPKEAVDELMDKAAALPQEKRSDFIKGWIRENQEAVVSRYFEIRSKGKKTRKFTYDVVPVPAAGSLKAVPRKAKKKESEPKRDNTGSSALMIMRRGGERRISILPSAGSRERPRITISAGMLTVSVPVSDSAQVGKELYQSDPQSILYSDPERGTAKMNVTVRFVGVKSTSSKKTTRSDLNYTVSRSIEKKFADYLSERHNYAGRDLENAKTALREKISKIASSLVSKAAARNKAIREYAP